MSPTPISSFSREYGQLEQQVEHLTKQVEHLTTTVEAMNVLMQEARGGWRTLAWLGGMSATVGGFASWASSHIKFTP